MEFGVIVDSLKDKNILITGSTGFLAKMFVEKVLRVQPRVKKLYLLLRAKDAKAADERLQNEVIKKDLFNDLREKYGENFHSFITEKVLPIPGDVTYENLAIKDVKTRELLWKDINMIIHSAATTNFYERYDISLNINVLGSKNVMNFAKKCEKIEVLLHVSTAYVSGEKKGRLLEKAFRMGETLKGNMHLDIEAEIELVDRRKKELHLLNSTLKAEKMAMKDLGIERARHFGWPNTYVFTKAMGEMLLGQLKGSFPLVIARPTIITSTWKEPFPGWIEGNRTIDSIIIGYAKGNLPCFAANRESPVDVIPGDLVVNAMVAMAVARSNEEDEVMIYHIGSSSKGNPVNCSFLQRFMRRYFSENPLIGKNGKAIRAGNLLVFSTLATFHAYMFLRYRVIIEMIHLVNIISCGLYSKKYYETYRNYSFLVHFVNLYRPYSFFQGCFDDNNLERLRMATKKDDSHENHIFYFDPKDVDWDDYFYNIHIPGLVKYNCS